MASEHRTTIAVLGMIWASSLILLCGGLLDAATTRFVLGGEVIGLLLLSSRIAGWIR